MELAAQTLSVSFNCRRELSLPKAKSLLFLLCVYVRVCVCVCLRVCVCLCGCGIKAKGTGLIRNAGRTCQGVEALVLGLWFRC